MKTFTSTLENIGVAMEKNKKQDAKITAKHVKKLETKKEEKNVIKTINVANAQNVQAQLEELQMRDLSGGMGRF